MPSKYENLDLTKNPIWVKRLGNFFDSQDLKKDGKITLDEFMAWVGNMEKMCKASPQKIKALEKANKEFWAEAGLVPGVVMNRQQFLEGMNKLAKAELMRKEQGKPTVHTKVSNAFFDVADTNNDDHVTLEELRTIMKACEMDPKGAESWLAAADTNKNGMIERDELCSCEFKFWYVPDDPSGKGMFGGIYE